MRKKNDVVVLLHIPTYHLSSEKTLNKMRTIYNNNNNIIIINFGQSIIISTQVHCKKRIVFKNLNPSPSHKNYPYIQFYFITIIDRINIFQPVDLSCRKELHFTFLVPLP